MTNPRKFSEKIALHTQKQAEETDAFEQIMKEVRDATVKPSTPPQPVKQTHLRPQMGMAFRGGSLPNVNQMIQQGDTGSSSGRMLYNNQSPRSSSGAGPVRTAKHHRTNISPYSPPMSNSMSSNPVNIDLPGLNFGSFLSPPTEPNWRRANSDSALNSINNSLLIPSVVPDSSEESSNNSNDPRENYGLGVGKTQDSPNSGCGDNPSLLEIPQSVSTGSLPDLTNFQFPPTLQQPIDMDGLNHSYSTSPLTGSSLTYSPSLSPHPPPGIINHHPPLNQSSAQQQQSPVQRPQQQQQQRQQQQQHTQSQHSPQSLIDNPLHVNTSFQNFPPNDNMLTAYRCPQRPSPQSSPLPFRSTSPHECHVSAPPSPTNQPTQQSADTYYLSQQAQALQQHFEQISMVDNTLPPRNNGHWQGGGMVNSQTYFYQPVPNPGATAGVTTQQSPQHPQPQTPQTPSSIPDIIFTDFDDRGSDPVEEYLASEAAAVALREGLGPIDLDGLEMLRDPSLVQLDSNAEDSFRLDRQ